MNGSDNARRILAALESGESIYNQNDATGFIKLSALRLRVKAMVEKQAKR